MRKNIATHRMPRQRIGRIAGAALAVAVMLYPAASNAQASIRTDVTAVLPAAAADISPGLCGAGDTPLCVGPYEAQIHLYSLDCAATGTFEGRVLAADGSCGIDLSAFMVPSLEGLTKPNCLTTHTYTSDAATAHGRPVNEVVIGGVARKFKLSYPFGVLGFRTGTGWVDGPDADEDPVGDQTLVLSIQVRPRENNDAQVPCITAPFSAASLTGVIRIFDVPAG